MINDELFWIISEFLEAAFPLPTRELTRQYESSTGRLFMKDIEPYLSTWKEGLNWSKLLSDRKGFRSVKCIYNYSTPHIPADAVGSVVNANENHNDTDTFNGECLLICVFFFVFFILLFSPLVNGNDDDCHIVENSISYLNESKDHDESSYHSYDQVFRASSGLGSPLRPREPSSKPLSDTHQQAQKVNELLHFTVGKVSALFFCMNFKTNTV